MDLKESALLGEQAAQHWYYQAKAQAVSRYLGTLAPRCILDVGAGSGLFSRHLLAHGPAQSAWCVDISYPTDSDSCEAGKPLHFRRSLQPADARPADPADRPDHADLVLMMDVLEHVEDDAALLRTYVQQAAPGTHFLLSVPAFNWLWSEHDVFLEHHRRYTLRQLEHTARSAGLEVLHGSYYFAAVLPLAAALRLGGRWCARASQPLRPPRSQLVQHAPWVNRLLTWVCRAELPLLRHNRLGGLTALCLARKP